MDKPPNNPVPLDYEPRAARAASKFRIGVVGLSLAIVPFLIAAFAVIELDRREISKETYRNLVEMDVTMWRIGLAVSAVGLFQRNGRAAALTGIGICLVESVLAPGLNIAVQ